MAVDVTPRNTGTFELLSQTAAESVSNLNSTVLPSTSQKITTTGGFVDVVCVKVGFLCLNSTTGAELLEGPDCVLLTTIMKTCIW